MHAAGAGAILLDHEGAQFPWHNTSEGDRVDVEKALFGVAQGLKVGQRIEYRSVLFVVGAEDQGLQNEG
jgi:hypothetical protein